MPGKILIFGIWEGQISTIVLRACINSQSSHVLYASHTGYLFPYPAHESKHSRYRASTFNSFTPKI